MPEKTALLEELWAQLQADAAPPDKGTLRRYMETRLRVLTKGRGGARQVVPLRLNPAQSRIWETPHDRIFVTKARQMGVSTLCAASAFAQAALIPATNALILAHTDEAARVLFGIIKRFYDTLPAPEKHRLTGGKGAPYVANAREVVFANGSRIACMTAGSRSGARGSTLTHIHCSEAAFFGDWGAELMASLEGALVPGGRIWVETTPMVGYGTWARDTWLASLDDPHPAFTPVFVPWWEDPTYQAPVDTLTDLTPEERAGVTAHGWTLPQIAWRRQTLSRFADPRQFFLEYPESPVDPWQQAGRQVWHVPLVLQAYGGVAPPHVDTGRGWRQFVPPDPDQRYLVGVDPAEGVAGGDFSAIQVASLQGEQVAEFADYVPVHQLAETILASPYAPQWVIPERNNHGHALIELLVGRGVPLALDHDRRWGLLATRASKAQWIARMAQGLHQGIFRLHSPRLYQQIVQYVYDDQGSAGGPDHGGDKLLAHDDLVSAWLLVAVYLVDPRADRQDTPPPITTRSPSRRAPAICRRRDRDRPPILDRRKHTEQSADRGAASGAGRSLGAALAPSAQSTAPWRRGWRGGPIGGHGPAPGGRPVPPAIQSAHGRGCCVPGSPTAAHKDWPRSFPPVGAPAHNPQTPPLVRLGATLPEWRKSRPPPRLRRGPPPPDSADRDPGAQTGASRARCPHGGAPPRHRLAAPRAHATLGARPAATDPRATRGIPRRTDADRQTGLTSGGATRFAVASTRARSPRRVPRGSDP